MTDEDVPEDLRCRVCLETDVNELMSLFCVASTQKMLLAHMVLACTGVPISTLDQLPQLACDGCVGQLDVAYSCWKRCRQSYGNFKRSSRLTSEQDDYCCRICLKKDSQELVSLFCICDKHLMKISDMIKKYAGLEITEDDGFPQYICVDCLGQLNIGYSFQQQCLRSNAIIRKQLSENSQKTRNDNLKAHMRSRRSRAEVITDETADLSSASESNTWEVTSAKLKPSHRIKSRSAIVQQVVRPNTSVSPPRKVFRPAKSAASPLTYKTTNSTSRLDTSPQKASNVISFSTPKEFKKLADTIVSKATKNSKLIPNRFKVLQDKGRYSASQIVSFTCSTCRTHYTLDAIKEKCVKCKLPFENFTPFKGDTKQKKLKPHTGFCCNTCSFFGSTVQAINNHLRKHEEKKITKQQNVSSKIPESAEIKEEMDCVIEPAIESDPLETVQRRRSIHEEKPSNGLGNSLVVNESQDTFNVTVELDESDEIDSQMREIFGMDDDPSLESVSAGQENPMNSDNGLDSYVQKYESNNDSDEENEIANKVFDLIHETDHYMVLWLKGLICCGCLQLFDSSVALRRHQQTVHSQLRGQTDGISCTICTVECESVHDVKMHLLLSVKKIFYFCKICSQLLLSDTDFEDHRSSLHPTIVTGSNDTVCVEPQNMMVSKQETTIASIELNAHLTADDKVAFDLIKETDEYKVLYLKCFLCCSCNRIYKTEKGLQLHCFEYHHVYRNPTGQNLCNQCHSVFKTEAQLIRHQLQGTKKLYYSCKLCRNILLENEVDFESHCATRHAKLMKINKLLEPTVNQSMLVQKMDDF
ncbi:uncharacterized protein LOC131431840 [Malaya genurostris]|uniref:uncharacterized protein LOC131431840 n=1 Tax=Malaya genurostris TaxID=325434 RepID=UPI0026F3E98F|nr:uncharacterized protein LOC131431840 [Malaya genurostris]